MVKLMLVGIVLGIVGGIIGIEIIFRIANIRTRRREEQTLLDLRASRLIDASVPQIPYDLTLYRAYCIEQERWRLFVFLNKQRYMLLDTNEWAPIDQARPTKHWSTWYRIQLRHLLPETRASVIELLLTVQ